MVRRGRGTVVGHALRQPGTYNNPRGRIGLSPLPVDAGGTRGERPSHLLLLLLRLLLLLLLLHDERA